MVFNSLQFGCFFSVVFLLYAWLNHRWQNRLLLLASYLFYATWDWRFLLLLFVSTSVNYNCALRIASTASAQARKRWLVLGVGVDLSILAFFKYFDFFVETFQSLFAAYTSGGSGLSLHVILPVGVSFYTFQSIAYAVDVYRKEIEPERDFITYGLFIAFFPQLIAGPIERAKRLLPQIKYERTISGENVAAGSFLILWGLFEKMVIADNLALIVDGTFAKQSTTGGAVIIASYAFLIQLLCDFDGYSNIARGLAKCLGIELIANFRAPYFATNPIDFWKRWHISLTTWFRDYVYIPLGGSRLGTSRTLFNVLITFSLMGLWHGASWNYILFGLYNALLVIAYISLKKILPGRDLLADRRKSTDSSYLEVVGGKTLPGRDFLGCVVWFQFCAVGGLIFRAHGLEQLSEMVKSVVSGFWGGMGFPVQDALLLLFFTTPVFVVHLLQFKTDDDLAILKLPTFARVAFYFVCIHLLFVFGVTAAREYVYFRF